MMGNDQQADSSPSPGASSTKQDEERAKQQEKIVDARDGEDEATKSKAGTKLLEEPHANSVKVSIAKKKKNQKSGIKSTDQSNLKRSQRITVNELTPENSKVEESSKNNNGEQSELVLQNQAEQLINSSKQHNAGEMKQEVKKYAQKRKVTAEQRRRTDEEIRKMVRLELAKHRREQAGLRVVQHEADKDDPKDKSMNASQNLKTSSPELAKNHTAEDTPNFSARKTRVMQNLGLMAPTGSPYCRKRKI